MSQALARVASSLAWLATGEVLLNGSVLASAVIAARRWGATGMGDSAIAYGAALAVIQLLAVGVTRAESRVRGHRTAALVAG